jgi:hypothetical protein
MVLSDEAVLITGLNASTGVRDGVPSPGRVTFVLAKRDGAWKVVHFHRGTSDCWTGTDVRASLLRSRANTLPLLGISW